MSDGVFFVASKLLALFTDPGNLIFLTFMIGSGLVLTPWARRGRLLLLLASLFTLVMALAPVHTWLVLVLEDRFPPNPPLPERIDGIIALGGVVDQNVSRARGVMAIGSSVERALELARLSRLHPEARLVFTGGSGDLLRQDIKEADEAAPLFTLLGIDPHRLISENRARNTHENAVFTRELVHPRPEETWVLITSAAHMPRAVGCFRRAGWRVIPWPVDFNTMGTESLRFGFDPGNLTRLRGALHEWIGLLIYRLTDRIDSWFPGPAA